MLIGVSFQDGLNDVARFIQRAQQISQTAAQAVASNHALAKQVSGEIAGVCQDYKAIYVDHVADSPQAQHVVSVLM